MAGQLSTPGEAKAPGSARRRRRALGLAALVLAVVALHACVTREIARRVDDFGARQALPPRIAVTYVREMQLEAPPAAPPVVRAAPPAPRPKRRGAKAVAAAPPASAPPAETVAEADGAAADGAASAPEAASSAAAAASAPDALPSPVAEAVPPSDAASAAGTTGAPPSEAPGAAFEWPASTRVTYALTGNYRGEVQGDAQVEWVKAGERYQVHIDMSVGPRAAPLIQRSMNSQGALVGDRLVPERYDEETRIVFRDTRRYTVTLGANEIALANGERRPRTVDVQDSASQFVQLAALFAVRPDLLAAGGSIEVMLALPRNVDLWVYDVLGLETLQTAFGPVEAVHLKPRRASRGPSDLSAEVWFAPQLRYMPARIRIRQDESTYVDLLVSKKPEIGAP